MITIENIIKGECKLLILLRYYRWDYMKMSIRKLSELSGVSIGHISEIENRKTVPSIEVCLRLAYALDCCVGELFSIIDIIDEEGEMKKKNKQEKLRQINVKEVIPKLENMLKNYHNLNPADKNTMLKIFIKRVIYYKSKEWYNDKCEIDVEFNM